MSDQPKPPETPSQTMNRLIREAPTKSADKNRIRAAFLAAASRPKKETPDA